MAANEKAELLEAIRRTAWTSHNIPIAPSESTRGAETPLIGDDVRTGVIKSLIRRMLRPGRPLRVLDLGSLEGGLSLEMAREGWEVVGVEARRENFEKAELIRRWFALPNLEFWHRDAKSLTRDDGAFDAILCCGLLYHLDDPFAFLRQVETLLKADGLLFVDTHVAGETRRADWQLSEPATLDGYDGRWFAEPSQGSLHEQMWSAVSNARSFWPTHQSLIRGLYRAGFHQIHDLFGAFDIDGEFALRAEYSRVWIAALKGW
jgi:SAM-dependent methyltransferase